MARNIKLIIITTFFIALFISCDDVKPPYEEHSTVITDTTQKVVLLEDYTGFLCGNCPAASEVAHSIKEKYPNNIVVIEVHAGVYAKPTKEHSYNFVSQVMKDLENYFNIGWGIGTPNGLIDRTNYENQLVLNQGQWEAAAVARMKQKAKVKIDLTPSYDSTTKTISCSTKLTFNDNCPSSYHLALYVVEDSIVQYQIDYRKNPVDIYDYVHNGIIRDALTSTWGEQISENDIAANSIMTSNYSKQIPPTADWRPKWIRIVAIVTDNANGYEVIQAGEKYILR